MADNLSITLTVEQWENIIAHLKAVSSITRDTNPLLIADKIKLKLFTSDRWRRDLVANAIRTALMEGTK